MEKTIILGNVCLNNKTQILHMLCLLSRLIVAEVERQNRGLPLYRRRSQAAYIPSACPAAVWCIRGSRHMTCWSHLMKLSRKKCSGLMTEKGEPPPLQPFTCVTSFFSALLRKGRSRATFQPQTNFLLAHPPAMCAVFVCTCAEFLHCIFLNYVTQIVKRTPFPSINANSFYISVKICKNTR